MPYAVVQLRQDTLAGDHFSLVGFQTQIKWGEQARVLRLIPGLEQAEFVRFGMVHRNTYINGPTVLLPTWQTRTRPDLFFAGQVSGVEGYVESAASGLVAGLNAARLATGLAPAAPPRTTAHGALAYYVSHADPMHYQPSNITFGIVPPLDRAPRGKQDRKAAVSERALRDLSGMGRRHRACDDDGSGLTHGAPGRHARQPEVASRGISRVHRAQSQPVAKYRQGLRERLVAIRDLGCRRLRAATRRADTRRPVAREPARLPGRAPRARHQSGLRRPQAVGRPRLRAVLAAGRRHRSRSSGPARHAEARSQDPEASRRE